MTENEKAALDALLRWHKFIGSIDKIDTDAPYQSLQVRELFAACDKLVASRKTRKRSIAAQEKP